jgi:hypothetical protein
MPGPAPSFDPRLIDGYVESHPDATPDDLSKFLGCPLVSARRYLAAAKSRRLKRLQDDARKTPPPETPAAEAAQPPSSESPNRDRTSLSQPSAPDEQRADAVRASPVLSQVADTVEKVQVDTIIARSKNNEAIKSAWTWEAGRIILERWEGTGWRSKYPSPPALVEAALGFLAENFDVIIDLRDDVDRLEAENDLLRQALDPERAYRELVRDVLNMAFVAQVKGEPFSPEQLRALLDGLENHRNAPRNRPVVVVHQLQRTASTGEEA